MNQLPNEVVAVLLADANTRTRASWQPALRDYAIRLVQMLESIHRDHKVFIAPSVFTSNPSSSCPIASGPFRPTPAALALLDALMLDPGCRITGRETALLDALVNAVEVSLPHGV